MNYLHFLFEKVKVPIILSVTVYLDSDCDPAAFFLMNTPSHFLMTAALRRRLRWISIPKSAVWIGSIAPDLPLYAMTFGAAYYFQNIAGWGRRETFRHIFDTLYFEDPYWIFFHNLLHAPLCLCILYILNEVWKNAVPRLHRWMKWFLLACLLHSIVDILTHHDDGPLILFPFEWQTRFYSPISYWDHRHYGGIFFRFEFWLDLILIVYLIFPMVTSFLNRFYRNMIKRCGIK